MSENRSPNEEEYREFLARLEREFHPRSVPPEEGTPSPYREARPEVVQPQQAAPQRVSFSLAVSRPRAVYVLLAINVIMFVLTNLWASRIALPYDNGRTFVTDDAFTAAIYILGAKWNPAIDAGQWWRLITPMFLHGSLLHLAFNSWALYALGPQVESVYGTDRFVALYGLAGLAGGIASYAFNPNALSVGASGAIFGLFGALAAFAYTARSLIGWEASKMQLGQMATLVVINLAFGFVPGSNIDNSAHIGGLLVGGLVGFALAPRYAIERQLYTPAVARRDHAVFGWTVAGIALFVMIGAFWFARMRFGL